MPHIIVINDNIELLEMLRELLANAGYSVAVYTSPARAITDLGRSKPALIVVDWIFGGEHLGMQLIQRLKLRPSTAAIPLLICTAAVRPVQESADFLRGKGIGMLFKPFTFDELLAAITDTIARGNRAAEHSTGSQKAARDGEMD